MRYERGILSQAVARGIGAKRDVARGNIRGRRKRRFCSYGLVFNVGTRKMNFHS